MRPVAGHGDEGVGNGQDAGADGDLCTVDAVGIAAAVVLLVMVSDDGHDRIREVDAFQNLGADQRVGFELFELFAGEFAGLGDDVFGDGQFADVVEQGGGLQRLQVLSGYAEFTAEFHGVDLDALQVVVGGMVLGVNRQCQSLNGAQVQRGHLLGVVLFGFQFLQVHSVGAKDDVDHGQTHEGGGFTEGIAQETECRSK